jgi:hypothetical protein
LKCHLKSAEQSPQYRVARLVCTLRFQSTTALIAAHINILTNEHCPTRSKERDAHTSSPFEYRWQSIDAQAGGALLRNEARGETA